jgi:two-component system NtrC family sensor kinase
VKVVDNGAGISSENLSQIFTPFFSTKDVGKGTGLGLSISHTIVREHKGWISVSSERGKGSVFSIYLPEKDE